MIGFLLKKTLDRNTKDKAGRLALHHAAMNGHLTACHKIMAAEPSFNEKETNKNMTSAQADHFEKGQTLPPTLRRSCIRLAIRDGYYETAETFQAEHLPKDPNFLLQTLERAAAIGDNRLFLPRDTTHTGGGQTRGSNSFWLAT